ncbi:MAG: hypothetical protein AVDCRST_MAG05-2963, partial [uncultured Rubrobacteraceae bacterium]
GRSRTRRAPPPLGGGLQLRRHRRARRALRAGGGIRGRARQGEARHRGGQGHPRRLLRPQRRGKVCQQAGHRQRRCGGPHLRLEADLRGRGRRPGGVGRHHHRRGASPARRGLADRRGQPIRARV